MKMLVIVLLVVVCPALAADFSAVRCGDELALRFERLDVLRQQNRPLQARIGLAGKKSLAVDLGDPAVQNALIVDLTGLGACEAVWVEIGCVTQNVPVSEATLRAFETPKVAQIEPGRLWEGKVPQVMLPDVSSPRLERLALPRREVNLADITFPVVADRDLPVLGSQNAVLLSGGSVWFSYRKAVMDARTLRVRHWRKFLVEVPVDPRWEQGSGDETLTLPAGGFFIHSSEERTPGGQLILGETSGGLMQGGQSVDTDEAGRLYFSNIERGAGLVRFDPAKKKFEQPPVELVKTLHEMLPPSAEWRRSWDSALMELVVMRGRVFIVFARHHRVQTPNGKVEVCSGVVSLPQAHWDDAERFRAELRLHAGCWDGAPKALYRGEVAVADYSSRKLAAPVETSAGLAFAAAPGAKGGPWHLDLSTDKISEGDASPPVVKHRGLRKQRLINIGAAGRPLIQFDCGEFRIARAAVPLLLPDSEVADAKGDFKTTANNEAGTLTVRFDVSTLGGAADSIAQGPAYALTPVPDEPDTAIGVCEYGYYFSRLDFSRLQTERRVLRRYLTMPGSAMPVQVGLGPYNTLWARHDEARCLYVPGYIGMTRLKYARQGRVHNGFTAESFHERLQGHAIDSAPRDNVKDYKELFHVIGGRLAAIGRGRPGRGGMAFSAGLEVFDPRVLGRSEVSTWMTRCFDIWSPATRVVMSAADGSLRQEVLAASSSIRDDYVRGLADASVIPASRDPKVFAWQIDAQGHLRDQFGFALPVSAQLAISRCGRFAFVLLEDGALMAWHLTQRRFTDALRLEARPLEFSRPGHNVWSAPNGQTFIVTALHGLSFHELIAEPDGRLTLRPHLVVKNGQAAHAADVVRCFMPDLRRKDGSYDFVLGTKANGDDPAVRVIGDFIPARE